MIVPEGAGIVSNHNLKCLRSLCSGFKRIIVHNNSLILKKLACFLLPHTGSYLRQLETFSSKSLKFKYKICEHGKSFLYYHTNFSRRDQKNKDAYENLINNSYQTPLTCIMKLSGATRVINVIWTL